MAAILLLLWFPISAVLSGASGAVFWNWFISGPGAAFEGHAPTITLIQALGISLVVRFMAYQFIENSKNEDPVESVVKGIIRGLAFLVLFWIVAIIYHAFM